MTMNDLGHTVEDLTGKERFNAQGLEGKIVITGPARRLVALCATMPQWRARVIVKV